MTVVSRGWNRLTLPGKFLFILVPLLVVATAALIILITAFGQLALDTLAANIFRSSASSWPPPSSS